MKQAKVKIFAGLGIISMIAAIFVAVKETEDANAEAVEEESAEELSFIDKAKWIFKHYYKTMILTVAAIFCFSMALHTSMKYTAAAVMAYKAADTAYGNLKSAQEEVVGKNKSSYISNVAAKKTMDESELTHDKVIKSDVDGEMLFYEPITKTFFKSSIKAIHDVEYDLRYALNNGDTYYISFRAFLDAIGLKSVKLDNANLIGWNAFDGELAIGYEVQVLKQGEFEGEKCIVLTYRLAPEYDFMDF